MRMVFKISFLLITLVVFLYSGRYLIYGLESNSNIVRNMSELTIKKIFGWEYQEKQGLTTIDYLLYRYLSNERNKEVSKFLIKISCNYVKENKNYDESVSFFNAVLNDDEEIIAFWMYNKIDLKKIKLSTNFTDGEINIQRILQKISNAMEKQKMVNYIEYYLNNFRAPEQLSNPCE